MKTNHSEDFSALKQLLASKRHEQPPAAYFDHFADRVISRLEADETCETSGWWNWLMELMHVRPVVASVAGAVMSAGLLTTMQFADKLELNPAPPPLSTSYVLAGTPSMNHPAQVKLATEQIGVARSFASVALTSLSPSIRSSWSGESPRIAPGWSLRTSSTLTGQ